MKVARISALLGFLVLFDMTLTLWAFAFPQLWFTVFHGVPYNDPEGFLRRCGANWAAFALFQAIALWRWRKETVWLAVVAGLRLGDMFTDATYVMVAQHTTLFARLTLVPTSIGNLILGWYLLRAYRWRQSA